MSTLEKTKLPNFEFEATSDIKGFLSDLKGKYVVLYFYPKDNTPGCTKESQNFSDLYEEFSAFDAEVYGISRDTLKSHNLFKHKLNLPFDLIADPKEELCNLFGVLKKEILLLKNKIIERSTFLIDPNGSIIKEWRKVKVTNHAQEVLDTLKLIISENK